MRNELPRACAARLGTSTHQYGTPVRQPSSFPQVSEFRRWPMVLAPPPAAPWAASAPRTRRDGPGLVTVYNANGDCSPHPRGWSRHERPRRIRGRLLPAPAGMVPRTTRPPTPTRAAPRTRGDGPGRRPRCRGTRSCSPNPRGWSRDRLEHAERAVLLPAPAGMVPGRASFPSHPIAAPRTRGDGPFSHSAASTSGFCSPHPRGLSPVAVPQGSERRLLPAPAGMVPARRTGRPAGTAAPRTRGDGPARLTVGPPPEDCSPHPRGWSLRAGGSHSARELLPAPAGMVPGPALRATPSRAAPRTRGDGPIGDCFGSDAKVCSPHPRGWSRPRDPPLPQRSLLPAPAGMVPPAQRGSGRADAAPRTRGDGPDQGPYSTALPICSPTRGDGPSGIARRPLPLACSPTRGDGPSGIARRPLPLACSPHPRGWSPRNWLRVAYGVLLPAGMVPPTRSAPPDPLAAPRTRGDGPTAVAVLIEKGLLPAPAALVPSRRSRRLLPRSASRTRGDGPIGDLNDCTAPSCSPHPRGWSPQAVHARDLVALLPAPAGMVPRRRCRWGAGASAARTRGDGPSAPAVRPTKTACSPHLRGWFRASEMLDSEVLLLLAPAGMIPKAANKGDGDSTAPHPRG